MDKNLFQYKLDDSYTGTTKLVWNLPRSLITIPEELQEADKYYFEYNGNKYTCNYVVNGSTKIFFAYKVDGLDGIAVTYFKNEDKLELVIRNNIVELILGADVILFEEVETPVITRELFNCFVRFKKDKACLVSYDEEADEFSVEEV